MYVDWQMAETSSKVIRKDEDIGEGGEETSKVQTIVPEMLKVNTEIASMDPNT